MIDYSNIYLIFRVHPHGDEDLHRVLEAKFVLLPNHMEVLEDHAGFFKRARKPADMAKIVHDLSRSMYYEVVNLEDIKDGKHPELLPEVGRSESELGPESTFEYHRQGMGVPQTLEFLNGKAFLDGHELSEEELQVVLDNVQSGVATMSYKDQDSVQKAEEQFMSLTKAAPHLEAALGGLREAVKAGHVHPDVLRTLSREIFTDSMVKRVGNKKAYEDFLSRPKQGVHVRMDANDFGGINKQHGFETGNKAITSMGDAMREALDESVGSKHGKLFRIGGDEFHAFVPSHDHAAAFARALRSKLEAVPSIGGTHNLSASIGFGHTPEHSELAMIEAKKAKKMANYQPGQAKTHAHSMVPGAEGPIPVGEGLPLRPPPAAVRPSIPSGQPAGSPVPQPTQPQVHPTKLLPQPEEKKS